jgi:transcriptional regulator with XRE-family HTH domain
VWRDTGSHVDWVLTAVNPATLLAGCLQLQALVGRMVDVDVDDIKGSARKVGSIGAFIREQREQAQVSVRQLAKLTGVSNPYLSQIERGLRKPSAEILQQIANGLRISAEQLYLRAGILETREGDAHVVTAIIADPVLTERQKSALVEIYESFCRENATPVAATTASRGPARTH